MATVEIELTTKLGEPFNAKLQPMFVPADATSIDLTDLVLQLLNLTESYSFDFVINSNLLEESLNEHIAKHGLTMEKTLQVEFQLAIAPPKFRQEEKIDDWGSRIVSLGKELIVSAYDGTLQQLGFDSEGKLKRKAAFKISGQPLTRMARMSDSYVVAGGYDGRVLFAGLEDDRMKLHLEFTLGGNYQPIRDICAFMTAQQPLAAILNEMNQIQMIAPLEELGKAHKDARQEKDYSRAPKVAEVFSSVDLLFDALSLSQYTQEELLVSTKQSIQSFSLNYNKSVGTFPAPAPCTSTLMLGHGNFIAGFMDRSLRLYDPRMPSPIAKTFTGHQSHVVSLKSHPKNSMQMTSCEIAGKALVWDLRGSIPYHAIDVYDHTLDKRSDQARILDLEWREDGYFAVGSARKVFWFTE